MTRRVLAELERDAAETDAAVETWRKECAEQRERIARALERSKRLRRLLS